MSAGDHDRLLARTSHLPHLLAALLVDNAFRGGIEGIAAGCGGGFRDATRMAAGSDDIWHDIVRTNADALTAELASISGRAESLRRLIAEGRFDEIRGFLARCRELRRGLYKGNSGKSPLSGEQA
jgi:prephenate dehydrogenase